MIFTVLNDLKTNALEKWDYSPAFQSALQSGYSGLLGPVILTAWTWQLETQLQAITNGGQLTQPVFTIDTLPGRDSTRTFADLYGPGQLQNTTRRIARRSKYPFTIGCWVDQQLGGMTMSRKLGEQVIGAMFYYRNRLTTIRHIDLVHWSESYSAATQLYFFAVSFEGDVLFSIDV